LGPDAWDEGKENRSSNEQLLFVIEVKFLPVISHIMFTFELCFLSLVRIRLGYLPFLKVAMEWQLEPVVLLV
jgi:hypothetical protein